MRGRGSDDIEPQQSDREARTGGEEGQGGAARQGQGAQGDRQQPVLGGQPQTPLSVVWRGERRNEISSGDGFGDRVPGIDPRVQSGS